MHGDTDVVQARFVIQRVAEHLEAVAPWLGPELVQPGRGGGGIDEGVSGDRRASTIACARRRRVNRGIRDGR